MEQIRYLAQEEKGRTRGLWEEIFPEDTGGFLDYYYAMKIQDNEILVLEQNGKIVSMLQLNPYRLQLGAAKSEVAYVIAVATRKECRHQGMMCRLLLRAMRDRRACGQPFLFLMPADEAIYRPFGFRFIYRQMQKTVTAGDCVADMPGMGTARRQYRLVPVAEEEDGKAAVFAEELLKETAAVYARRDADYYRILRMETEAEDGTLAWVMAGDRRIGLFSYTKAGDAGIAEIREPLFLKEYQGRMEAVLKGCFEEPYRLLRIYGLPETGETSEAGIIRKPVIMARALNLPILFAGVRAEEELEFVLRIHDDLLPENNGVFCWQTGPGESRLVTEWTSCRQGVDIDVSVEALTQLLFAWSTPEKIARGEHCIMTPAAQKKWGKLHLLSAVCLNEVV